MGCKLAWGCPGGLSGAMKISRVWTGRWSHGVHVHRARPGVHLQPEHLPRVSSLCSKKLQDNVTRMTEVTRNRSVPPASLSGWPSRGLASKGSGRQCTAEMGIVTGVPVGTVTHRSLRLSYRQSPDVTLRSDWKARPRLLGMQSGTSESSHAVSTEAEGTRTLTTQESSPLAPECSKRHCVGEKTRPRMLVAVWSIRSRLEALRHSPAAE